METKDRTHDLEEEGGERKREGGKKWRGWRPETFGLVPLVSSLSNLPWLGSYPPEVELQGNQRLGSNGVQRWTFKDLSKGTDRDPKPSEELSLFPHGLHWSSIKFSDPPSITPYNGLVSRKRWPKPSSLGTYSVVSGTYESGTLSVSTSSPGWPRTPRSYSPRVRSRDSSLLLRKKILDLFSDHGWTNGFRNWFPKTTLLGTSEKEERRRCPVHLSRKGTDSLSSFFTKIYISPIYNPVTSGGSIPPALTRPCILTRKHLQNIVPEVFLFRTQNWGIRSSRSWYFTSVTIS